MSYRLDEGDRRERLRGSGSETVTNAAVPTYYHAGPITGDYVHDIAGRGSLHFHVTLYKPIAIRPVRSAFQKYFGGFRRCDQVLFPGPVGNVGELGVLHAEIDIPLMPPEHIRRFLIRLIQYIFHDHTGCEAIDPPRDGAGPLDKPIQPTRIAG